jgi:hypothetical protein
MFDVDTLTLFAKRTDGTSYRFMTRTEVEALAEELSAVLKDETRVLCVDSGARPLANLIAKRTGCAILGVKVPHFPGPALGDSIMLLLSKEELSGVVDEEVREAVETVSGKTFGGTTRRDAIRHLAPLIPDDVASELTENLESYVAARALDLVPVFNTLLGDTAFARVLGAGPVLLEEYVTAGAVLRGLNILFSLFSREFSYRLVCFNYNGSTEEAPEYLLYSKRYGDPREVLVAYPYENRLDLLGFWYSEGEDGFTYTDLTLAVATSEQRASTDELMTALEEVLRPQVEVTRALMPTRLQGEYLQGSHLSLYALYLLSESATQRSFFEQLFEMMAPCWSPLDDEIHLSFTKAIMDRADEIRWAVETLGPQITHSLDELITVFSAELAQAHRAYWELDEI